MRFAPNGAAVISLADYTPTTLKYIKTHDLACVYVLGVEGGRPCKIGHALSLRYRFDQAQAQHPRVSRSSTWPGARPPRPPP